MKSRSNIRLRGNQINTVIQPSQLAAAWSYFGFPKGKCPTIAQIEAEDECGEPWYCFEGNNAYFYVNFTSETACQFDTTFNKFGRF